MILRALTLAGGIMGAAFAAQGPGFARAYLFELETHAQTLAAVIADFDRAAAEVGLDRAAAFEHMQGTPLFDRRRIDLERQFAGHAALTAKVAQMRSAGPFMRSYHLWRDPDAGTLRRTWARFHPNLPRSRAEMLFAAIGGVSVALLAAGLFWLARWPHRRHRRRALRA
ncbi:DUF2937 family protein [Sulfitobacter delicatus]|uniref:DUF2937 family protein n=1 Tax=Sulfitobacter delicatus TaxID=218672 RepID=A0A1G7LRT8_9RHOB|nr:DUF2937 family protein [Sulfitobacter delicatus]SDF52143.1 Protein of unknown function [Sulfitobacter delicatus]